jgi:hypothetical protein
MHYIHPDFSFTVFQMAMKLYRQRANCSYLLDLLSLKTRTVHNRGGIEHVTALSRIFHGWLLVRKHSLFPVHPPKDGPSNDSSSPRARFFVCPHLGEASWKLPDRGRGIIEWKLPKRHAEQAVIQISGEGSVQCKFCVTECCMN